MLAVPLKTRIPDRCKAFEKISFCTYRKYCPEFPTADPLLDFCSNVVGSQHQPTYWLWTAEKVAHWIAKELSHPELKEAFIKNKINGKSLMYLEADKLPKMGIKKFTVIKEITKTIRELCKVNQKKFEQNISLPVRCPGPRYFSYKARRLGPTSYFMTPSEFSKITKIIRDETTEERRYYALLNHWNRIPPFRPWCPHVMIGESRRVNPMTGTTIRKTFRPKGYHYLNKDLCKYHLPCKESKTDSHTVPILGG